MKNKKSFKIILIIIGILVVCNLGYYFWTNWQNFFPNKDSSSNGAESWKTYDNSKMGIELKYPDLWTVQESTDTTVGVYPPASEGAAVYFSVAKRDDIKSLEDVKKTLAPDISTTTIQIGDASGFEYDDSAYESIWLLNSGQVYLIRTYKSLYLGNVADQILATFKFTN